MSKPRVLSTYRNLFRLIQNLPSKSERIKNIETLRSTYKANSTFQDPEKIQGCIQEAGEKIAYLRIITPKTARSKSSSSTTRLIYTKDGVVELNSENGTDNVGVGTRRDSNGKVISNWNGKNLDPCSVKTHNSQLKRMGFLNNLHAKGIF